MENNIENMEDLQGNYSGNHFEPYRELQKLHEGYGGTEAAAFLVFAHIANNLFVSIELMTEAIARQTDLMTKLLERQSK